jgi:hypothetical protein
MTSTKKERKPRNGMVFLAENGEGTEWMTVDEYSKKLREKMGNFQKEVTAEGSLPGRPPIGAPPKEIATVEYVKDGPKTTQAIYYRINKGHLEKKIVYGKITLVREVPKKK